VLASGEDLKCLSYNRAHAPSRWQTAASFPDIEAFVARARKFEFAAMGHVKLARNYAQAISLSDNRIAGLTRLFAAGTAAVVDAIDEICDSEGQAFRHGFDPLVYLRGRCLIHKSAGSLRSAQRIVIDDRFLLAERIELGALLDLCAQFLDLLDQYFDLFQNAPATSVLVPPQRFPQPMHIHSAMKNFVTNMA